MGRTVKSYVQSCATCQRAKPSTTAPSGLLQPLPTPSKPWSHVSLDLITDLPLSEGHDSIVVFVDMLTKMAHFAPTNKTLDTTGLAHLFMQHVVKHHGLPKVLVSDRDPRMTSEFWRSLFNQLGFRLNMSTAYHPQTDGQTERTNRMLDQILCTFVHPFHGDWAKNLPMAEFGYRTPRLE